MSAIKKISKSIYMIFMVLIFTFTGTELFAKSYKPDFIVNEFIEKQTEVRIFLDGKNYVIVPDAEECTTALIFYPGGYVNYESYLPLLAEISRRGIICIMPKMFSDLAIFNISSANKIIDNEKYINVTDWYIGGHSLGGAMAAIYAGNNSEKLKGVILLAAYSTSDLTESSLKVLSVYGSNDGVLKINKYDKYKKNLPADFKEAVVEGGNHSGFGNYGFQKGDGQADVDADEQKKITADLIFGFIN